MSDAMLDGKVAVVTGSTKGIGLAVAKALMDAGASVAVSSGTAANVAAVVEELAPGGRDRVVGVPCDVRSSDDCRKLMERTVAEFGRLDILVNNAGLGRFASIREMDPADWQVQIDTNLNGVFHCSKAALSHLEASGDGWIVNVASLASRNPFAGGVAYNASKFGLLGMTEAMMLDLRHHGVRVTAILPGSVNTHFFDGEYHPEDDWKLGAEDVARAVLDILAYPGRALPSRIELRPSRPPRK
ncbi:MAG: SDR family oxidoreductase [Gemmatimonadota bacterium]